MNMILLKKKKNVFLNNYEKNKRDLKELERERIESLILEFLRYDSFVSLNLISDFYDRMCEWLDLSLKVQNIKRI